MKRLFTFVLVVSTLLSLPMATEAQHGVRGGGGRAYSRGGGYRGSYGYGGRGYRGGYGYYGPRWWGGVYVGSYYDAYGYPYPYVMPYAGYPVYPTSPGFPVYSTPGYRISNEPASTDYPSGIRFELGQIPKADLRAVEDAEVSVTYEDTPGVRGTVKYYEKNVLVLAPEKPHHILVTLTDGSNRTIEDYVFVHEGQVVPIPLHFKNGPPTQTTPSARPAYATPGTPLAPPLKRTPQNQSPITQ